MTTTEDAFNVEGGRQGEQVIPIAEETLRVGKRIARGGQVRVRSYVVETPVSEQVNLRDEHVTIERRPADRRLSGAEDPFRERTVEMDEAREEPVVSKEARVREELVVNKDVETRNETVSDKVRRTEVEVQDDRNARGAGTGGEPGRR
jgi:stress response protein YsnF